jgi:hypothetical protein
VNAVAGTASARDRLDGSRVLSTAKDAMNTVLLLTHLGGTLLAWVAR